MKSIISILALLTLQQSITAAVPGRQSFLATFDNLPQVEDDGATAQVPTPYVNLGWNNFFVASPGNSILITPHSLPAGALGAIPGDPISNITVDYPSSHTKAFDLVSTWVACPTFDNYPPEPCVIRFTGYKATWNGTALFRSVNHEYAFSGGEAMEFVRLPRTFRALKTVDVVIAISTGTLPQTVQLDDVRGTLYQ